MRITNPFQGSLFANDFLKDAITRLDDWQDIGESALSALEASGTMFSTASPSPVGLMKASPRTI